MKLINTHQKGLYTYRMPWRKVKCNAASLSDYCISVKNASRYERLPKKQPGHSPDRSCQDEGIDDGVNCPWSRAATAGDRLWLLDTTASSQAEKRMRATLPRVPPHPVLKHHTVVHTNAALKSKIVSLHSNLASSSAVTPSRFLRLGLLIRMLFRNIQQAMHSHCLALRVCLNPLRICRRRACCRSSSTKTVSWIAFQDFKLVC